MDSIINEILRREGWGKYTNRPSDRGGPTKWGITQKAWSDYIGRPATIDDVKSITDYQARRFYRTEYIEGPNFDRIVNPLLQEFVIDCGVNHGVSRAARWLQQVIGVKADGRVGPVTLSRVNSVHPAATLLRLIGVRQRFYAQIASDQLPADPDLPNLRGWINRAAEFLDTLATEIEGDRAG